MKYVTLLIALAALALAAFPLPDTPICKGLADCYVMYNKLYFGGELPPAEVAYGPCPIYNVMACTYKDKGDGHFIIHLIPKYNVAPDTAHFNLLHESCHVAHWDEEIEEHGPVFQKCMHRLADLNAFESIW